MASDSEIEEFFDCEEDEITLQALKRKKSAESVDVLSITSAGSMNEAQQELAKKEQELIKRTQQLFEKRKLEDELLIAQLDEIQRQKKLEKARKRQQKLRQRQRQKEMKDEEEFRRRRLDELRRSIDDTKDSLEFSLSEQQAMPVSSNQLSQYGPVPDLIQSTKSKSLDREVSSGKDERPNISKSLSLPRKFEITRESMKQVIEDVERAVRYFTSAPTSSRHVTAIEEESCKAPETEQQKQEEILQAADQEPTEKKVELADSSTTSQQLQAKHTNPLSLHIMKKTNDYPQYKDSDEDSIGSETSSVKSNTSKKRGLKSKLLGKLKRNRNTAETNEVSDEEEEPCDGKFSIKIKAASSHKGPYDFDLSVPVQDLNNEHKGPVWTMKFSPCGYFLATGGQDTLLRVWVLKGVKDVNDYLKCNDPGKRMGSPSGKKSPSTSSLNSDESANTNSSEEESEDEHAPFCRKPLATYMGHSSDLLDISWSKTARLWHISRRECLCCFQHIEFVSSISFHPKDDRYFISGSLDGKLRLWNIPEKKVALWNEIQGVSKFAIITAVNFAIFPQMEEIVVGTYDGKCLFYTVDQLKYRRMLTIKTSKRNNKKVTGIDIHPSLPRILVTTNDSRVRLYDLSDNSLVCKYKGSLNYSSQIRAVFNHDGRYVISGSEDQFVYLWRTNNEFCGKLARRDRNIYWEGIKAHSTVVSAATFAPKPTNLIKIQFTNENSRCNDFVPPRCEAFVTADLNGCLKVFINKFKPETDS
ncbi:DgyrCDS2340 [Dimorphilus gyrociliatus]|uniref:WD repeat-containing protein 44 n=1 Tax=Dimorphilus gyrociliatus TaxID=2664684 RepID=A0A7I8V9Z8_9ANNE|nr:DgyrCDS2340 [Dimorphilus gyrociliatus]